MKPIVVPKVDEMMTEGVVASWMKREGESVAEGEPLVSIETEKVTYDVTSPGNGSLYRILSSEGITVPVGGWLGVVLEEGDDPRHLQEQIERYLKSQRPEKPAERVEATAAETAQETTELRGARPRATPRARRLAREKGVELTNVRGTGSDGIITEDDVDRYLEKREILTKTGLRVRQVIPMSTTRKTIAENMITSLRSAAQVTILREVDASNLVYASKKYQQVIEKETGVKPTYTHILMKIAGKALQALPIVNATLEDDKIKIIEEINIGVATALERGLIVPVVKRVDEKSLKDIAVEVNALSEKARRGQLTLGEITSGTFTVTNLGMYGVDSFTPIVNPTQVAILGVGRLVEKPVAIKELDHARIEVRPRVTLSLTFDHRVIDGHVAAEFLQEMTKIIEDRQKLGELLE